jgi:hypothetical protein
LRRDESTPILLPLFQQLQAAEKRTAATRKSLRIALVASLLLHAAVLLFELLMPPPPMGAADTRYRVNSPLQARLHQRAQSAPSAPQSSVQPQPKQARQATRKQVISSKQGQWSRPDARTEVAPSGAELARRALAMARGMAVEANDGGSDAISTQQDGKGKSIEPLSLQWYFDSFITKLNRSARFVPREPKAKGQRKALVEIRINRDGSLNAYRILRAADQQAEIEYIKAVVDRAVPFAAFPPDIRDKTDTLSLTICIHPPGESGGYGFSRTSGNDC